MALLKGYVLPHPPLAVPAVGRGQEKGIKKTLEAFNKVAEEIAEFAPDTIIYITPHNVLYSDYFHISPGESANGDFSRFNSPNTRFETIYDEALAEEISRIAEISDFPAGTLGEKNPSLDHGVTVPMWFINNRYTDYKSLRVSQSGMGPDEHYMMGRLLTKAAEALGRKIVIIASADLSHKLKNDGPYGFSPEGQIYDTTVTEALDSGDFLTLFKISEDLREKAAECGHNSIMILAGALDKQKVESKLLSYEGPFGVGYAIVALKPIAEDENRDFLDKFAAFSRKQAQNSRDNEDKYRELARKSLEHKIRYNDHISLPDNLPEELTKTKAGVFVSLHKNGRLRGCIGTISPTTKCVASEIIQNAVSAGLSDTRFEPVKEEELPLLTYKVDVLSAPEPITGPEELDIKRYGVIVSSGFKRGLLLPNLDGIDTVDEQISIARQKAGISEREQVTLERFEVIRHE